MYDTLVLIDSIVSIQVKILARGNITLYGEVVHKTTSLQGFLNLGFAVIERWPSE